MDKLIDSIKKRREEISNEVISLIDDFFTERHINSVDTENLDIRCVGSTYDGIERHIKKIIRLSNKNFMLVDENGEHFKNKDNDWCEGEELWVLKALREAHRDQRYFVDVHFDAVIRVEVLASNEEEAFEKAQEKAVQVPYDFSNAVLKECEIHDIIDEPF